MAYFVPVRLHFAPWSEFGVHNAGKRKKAACVRGVVDFVLYYQFSLCPCLLMIVNYIIWRFSYVQVLLALLPEYLRVDASHGWTENGAKSLTDLASRFLLVRTRLRKLEILLVSWWPICPACRVKRERQRWEASVMPISRKFIWWSKLNSANDMKCTYRTALWH